MADLVSFSSAAGSMLYKFFLYAVIVLSVVVIFGFIGFGIIIFLRYKKADVDVRIKRKGITGFVKDKLIFVKTDEGEMGYLKNTKQYIHPDKVRPFLRFIEGKKTPVIYLYTEDMKEFFPIVEEDYEIVKEIEVDTGDGKKKVKVKAVKVDNIIRADDKMIRNYGYKEYKMSQERSKIESPFKGLIEAGKWFAIGLFFLLGIMIIANSMKQFGDKMVAANQEQLKGMEKILNYNNVVYNTTKVLVDGQKQYLVEMRRLSETISKLVETEAKNRELYLKLLQNLQQGGGNETGS